MRTVRFITDGRPHGWRYRSGEEASLTQRDAEEVVVDLEIAIYVGSQKVEHAVGIRAHDAIAEAKKRSLK